MNCKEQENKSKGKPEKIKMETIMAVHKNATNQKLMRKGLGIF